MAWTLFVERDRSLGSLPLEGVGDNDMARKDKRERRERERGRTQTQQKDTRTTAQKKGEAYDLR